MYTSQRLQSRFTISQNIDGAICQSRGAIIFLSKHFLRSGWCKKEFDVAITQQLHTPGFKVVVICLDDPSDYDDEEVALVPTYITRYIFRRTYLQFHDRHFWRRLSQCLRKPNTSLRSADMKRGEANLVQINELVTTYGTASLESDTISV